MDTLEEIGQSLLKAENLRETAKEATQETPAVETIEEKADTEVDLATTTTETVIDPLKPEDELIALEEEKPVIETSKTFDTSFLKDIDIDVKTPEDLKEAISTIKNERDQYKTKSEEIYANEDVRSLNDFVKNGGDLKEYTDDIQSIAGYKKTLEALKKISPTEAYRYSILQQYGVEDIKQLPEDKQTEIEEYIESQSPVTKEIEGKKVINAEIAAYQSEIDKRENNIKNRNENLEKKNVVYASKVSTAIQKLTGVDGLKVSESEKQEMAAMLKDPKKTLSMLMPLDENGLPDAGALVEIVYRYKYGKRNTQLLLKQAKGDGKRDIFKGLTNSEIEATQHVQSPAEKNGLAAAVSQV